MMREWPQKRSLILLVVAAALLVVGVARLLATVPPAGWELSLFREINGGGDLPKPLWWPVMQFGSLTGALVLASALAIGWSWSVGGRVAIATGSAWAAAQLLKSTVGRGRPASLGIDIVARSTETSGTGFPSGHAAVAFGAAVVVVAYLSGWWRLAPVAVAILVALARVYVGVHLPLDVVGGAAVGVALGSIVLSVLPAGADRPEPWWAERRRAARAAA